MFLSLFYLASQSTSLFINTSIVHPIIRSIHPVLPYLGIWELAYITFSKVYFSPAACLFRDVICIADILATTFAYRLEEIYWSLAFWPILLRDAVTGFPSFASDIAGVALRLLFGIASCRSPGPQNQRQPGPRRKPTRRTITRNGDSASPIAFNSDAQVQSMPRISLREASPPIHTPDINTDSSTVPSATTSTTSHTLLPHALHTRSQSERSATPTRDFTSSKRNKFPIYPSPPTICSPSPTLRSPSVVFSATSTNKTILINLPIVDVDSSTSLVASVSSPSSMYTPPRQSPAMCPSSSSTTPVSSPYSSMLKFSTPPSPLRSKSKAKRIQSRKRTPATTSLSPVSPLRRSPTPYPSHSGISRASASLIGMTPSTLTTPKAKTRNTTKMVVTTPTPKSKSHQQQQQQQVGKGNRNNSRKGNTRASGNSNPIANGGGMENRSERHRHLA